MVRSLYPYHQAARTRCSSIPLVTFLGKFFEILGDVWGDQRRWSAKWLGPAAADLRRETGHSARCRVATTRRETGHAAER
jgi:hypothetical protein